MDSNVNDVKFYENFLISLSSVLVDYKNISKLSFLSYKIF